MAYKIKNKKFKEKKIFYPESGEASMKIELADGEVKVFHGTDKSLLYKTKAKEGYWDNLWEAIQSKKFKVKE